MRTLKQEQKRVSPTKEASMTGTAAGFTLDAQIRDYSTVAPNHNQQKMLLGQSKDLLQLPEWYQFSSHCPPGTSTWIAAHWVGRDGRIETGTDHEWTAGAGL